MIVNAQIHYFLADPEFAKEMVDIQNEHKKTFEVLKKSARN